MKHISELLPAVVKPEMIEPLTPIQARLLTAAAAIQQQPPNRNELAFMAKELVQCTLPHRDPGDPPRWTRVNGNLTLTLVSAVGYCRLFGTMISFSMNDQACERRWNMAVSARSQLWWDPVQPDQLDLFESWIQLGQDFFDAITASPVPLDYRALKALKRSPLALDLYAWAAHKVYTVKQKQQPQWVPWKGLHQQFGADYKSIKNFRQKAVAALRKIEVLYRGMKFELIPYGIVIFPASELAFAAAIKEASRQGYATPAKDRPSPYF
jgi:hypothetical protein